MKKNQGFLLAGSFILLDILEWQILVKIKRISSVNLLLEYHNICIKFNENPENKLIFDFMGLFDLKTQFSSQKNKDFLQFFCENQLYNEKFNVFSENLHKILGIVKNSNKNIVNNVFSLRKIALIVKITDNFIGNWLLLTVIRLIKPEIHNIYLNFLDILQHFTNEETLFLLEFKEFSISFLKNLISTQKYLIFLDCRDLSLKIHKENSQKFLEIFYEFSQNLANIQFFILYSQRSLIPLEIPQIPLNFADPELLALFFEVLTKDLMIKDLPSSHRAVYFKTLISLISPENSKNIYSLAYKFSRILLEF